MPDRRPSLLGDRRVTLEHLRAFALLAEGKGFHDTGAQLHRSQSAVTQSLKRLEEILGCKLLERRQGHIIGLTSEGERFLPAVNEILARTSEAVSAMQQPEISGRLVIGVPDDFRITDLHGAISRCAGLNRSLRLEVISALSSQLLRLLDSKALDLAILKRIDHDTAGSKARATHVLRREPLHWVAAHRRDFDNPPDIPLIIFPEGCCYRAAAFAALDRAGKSGYGAYVSASYENIRSAISAGLGVGILPASALASDHVILDKRNGFPLLPDVELVMIDSSQNHMTKQLAHFLSLSSATKTQSVVAFA